MKKIVFSVIAIVLFVTLTFSIIQLRLIQSSGAEEAALHKQLMEYKPELTVSASEPAPPALEPVSPASTPKGNQNILDLQAKYPDAVGWITIPNTNVDYPFVQAKDNSYYLRRDLDGKTLSAGTLFMDYRNSADLSGFNTIIYGHNMKNGSMFGTLKDFDDQTFFDANQTGTVFIANKTYAIEFFAYIVLKADDSSIYDPSVSDPLDETAFLAHAKSAARYYRDIGVTAGDHILTLSTCDYEFNDARMVLLGRLKEI